MSTSLRRFARPILASLALALMVHPTAWANDPATSQLREQQRTLQLQERRQRLERWQRRRQPGPVRVDPAPPTRANSHCWPTAGLRLSGNRVLSNQQLEAVLRPLWRPCLSVDDVNTLLRAITDSYVQAGYPASRPYLAHRPQAGKPLAIVIVEGFVESIELAGADLPLSLRGAFPDLLGHPLYLPALEQGLDQLNRLRAYDLNADLLPGEIQSGTRVVIQPRRTGSRWHLDSRLDNRGSDLTGRHRLNLGLGLDSPLGLNDDLRLGVASTVFDAPGQSQGVNLYYSVPYGPWSLAVNASWMRSWWVRACCRQTALSSWMQPPSPAKPSRAPTTVEMSRSTRPTRRSTWGQPSPSWPRTKARPRATTHWIWAWYVPVDTTARSNGPRTSSRSAARPTVARAGMPARFRGQGHPSHILKTNPGRDERVSATLSWFCQKIVILCVQSRGLPSTQQRKDTLMSRESGDNLDRNSSGNLPMASVMDAYLSGAASCAAAWGRPSR